jgi:hypothetical protein
MLQADGQGETCQHCHGDSDRPHDEDSGGHAVTNDINEETLARLRRTMLRWAIQVLSGPDGLASYLRTGPLKAPLSGRGIVLDARDR